MGDQLFMPLKHKQKYSSIGQETIHTLKYGFVVSMQTFELNRDERKTNKQIVVIIVVCHTIS